MPPVRPRTDARGLAALAGLAGLLLVVLAVPAAAHGRSADASNYRSRVVRAPDLPRVRWRVRGGDELLSVANTGTPEVVVLDYEGDPYLRVGPDGVFENRDSEAVWLNRDRFAATPVPPGVGSGPRPEWARVSDGTSWAWHDHRVHWMSPRPPAPVLADPGSRATITRWRVPFDYGGRRLGVRGTLEWVPGPSPWPWLLGALAVTAPPVLAGLGTRPRGDRWPGLARPAATVLGAVSVANLTNLANDLLAAPAPGSTRVLAAVQTGAFVSLGVAGAWRAWRGGDGAFTALAIGAGSILVGQGLLLLRVLDSSQLATVFPPILTRAVVALSLAQALPVAAAAVLGARRTTPPPRRSDVRPRAATR